MIGSLIAISIIFLYMVLFKVRNPLQFYIKYFTYVMVTMIISIIVIPLSLLRPFDLRNVRYIANTCNFFYKMFELKIEVENQEVLNKTKAFIIVANHQSSTDFIVMMKCWPIGNCTPLAKKELIYAGPFGIACWLNGVTYIDRLNHDKAKRTIEDLAIKINKENLGIWVFPEGTRNSSNELLSFKKGAFHLAVQAQIPIIPVVVSSYSNHYSKKEKKFIPGNN